MRTERSESARLRSRWVSAAVVTAATACRRVTRRAVETEYSNSPDSGAVAPAMKLDTSLTKDMPDSTAGGPPTDGEAGRYG